MGARIEYHGHTIIALRVGKRGQYTAFAETADGALVVSSARFGGKGARSAAVQWIKTWLDTSED